MFLDLTPKAKATKSKINKWDYKLKASAEQRKPSTTYRRQPIEWEKIFAKHISNKRLISKIYKEQIQFNSKNKNK